MREYDRIGDQWVPYLMRADHAARDFTSVRTDRWGMRYTVRADGAPLTVDTLAARGWQPSCNVLLGSSAVFGVGSSSDAHTISSYLTRDTSQDWLNFGGRAYNSTQEVVRLMLHLPPKLKNIVVFSGVNNLTLAFLSSSTSPVYNSFFSQSVFERAMSNPPGEYIGVRRALNRLGKEINHRFFGTIPAPVRAELGDAYADVMSCFDRDLRVLKCLADGVGARLIFAVQPLATWLDKNLSSEEQSIFTVLDTMSDDWAVLADQISRVRDRYFEDVSRVCVKAGVAFCNLNLAAEFRLEEWLFVDRVHLTDRGCELAANVLKREFSL
jgi:hypothetical protein